ncbi:hypothetical protein OG625_36490 [Streptomyces sp. NBC_01351]|uniref:hypothetical protein n=1 Tax=Streptomyces sp. NBC_01351 TaxID=2903833 RepID=UPI002E35FB49|nr:hypothetical protein [Streptomyces sp. NBC_01351]
MTAVVVQIQDEDEDEAQWIVSCLVALQLFDRGDTRLRLEMYLWHCVSLVTEHPVRLDGPLVCRGGWLVGRSSGAPGVCGDDALLTCTNSYGT